MLYIATHIMEIMKARIQQARHLLRQLQVMIVDVSTASAVDTSHC